MLEIIIGIYAGIVWLVFKKFKLLPWNFTSKVVVYSLPIVGSLTLILCLNYFTPITSDVRVINKSVDINPQILGRVTKMYVVSNQEVKKGDTLFTLDAAPYRLDLKQLEAKLKDVEAGLSASNKDIEASKAAITSIKSQLLLAGKRESQYKELVKQGAANKFDLEQAQTSKMELEGKLASAQSQLEALQANISGSYEGENSSISAIKSSIEKAKWSLNQTVVLAPADGTIPNVQINAGAILTAFKSAFVLIMKEQSVIGLFAQNELKAVKPGDEVELSLRTEPGQIIKAKLETIVDATSQGIMNNARFAGNTSGLPDTASYYPELEGKLAAKFVVDDYRVDFTTGARGTAVIYSEHMKLVHIIRKVMIRVNSKMNYIIPKLH